MVASSKRQLAVVLLLSWIRLTKTSQCEHDCGVFGVCLLDTASCLSNECKWKCICQHGYGGHDCSFQVEHCDDKKTHSPLDVDFCYNGGRCETYIVDNKSKGKATRCNCQNAVGSAKVYAGHQCEYPEQHSCEDGVEFSNYAFCVNGGTCKKIVPEGSPHPLCQCKNGFAGRHCQFLATAVPKEEVIYVKNGGSSSSKTSQAVNHTHSTHYVSGHSNVQTSAETSKASRAVNSTKNGLPAGTKFMISFVFISAMILMVGIRRSRRKRHHQIVGDLEAETEERSDETEIVFGEMDATVVDGNLYLDSNSIMETVLLDDQDQDEPDKSEEMVIV
jgi:hypothetical protein